MLVALARPHPGPFMRPLAFLLLLPLPLLADDLATARSAHAKELARLRQKLLDDIDVVIKKESAGGAGIDYLLKEKRGYVEGGTLPVLPKLLPASRAYLDGKARADGKLADALEAAGRKDEAKALRAESRPKGERPKPSEVNAAADLRKFLEDSVWEWWVGGNVTLRWDGRASHPLWDKAELVKHWGAIDRRTVVIRLEKGRDNNKIAVLSFSEDLTKMTLIDFDGTARTEHFTRK